MTKQLDALKSESGFTIIEVMVAAMLLVIGLFGTLALFDTSNALSVQNKDRVGATNLARQVAEDIRTFDYDRVDSTNILSDLAAAGITDQDAIKAGIQQVRGKVTYTINVIKTSGGNTTSPCVLDSGTDGARAATDTGYYCSGSATAGSGSTDGNPDDFRRVEVTVTWPGPSGTAACSGLDSGLGRSCVTQAVLLQNPSGGVGPSIDTITLRSAGLTINGQGVIEDGTAATFDVTTRAAADEVHWTADDGVSAGTATKNGSSKAWFFTWTFPASLRDGPHTITVQAFLLGAGGSAKPKVQVINLQVPATPDTNVSPLNNAGVDTRVTPIIDFTWQQNPEGDIRGYKVYRMTGAAPVLSGTLDPTACSTGDVTIVTCFYPIPAADLTACDALLPAPCPLTFYVVAFDNRWTVRANPSPMTCTAPLSVNLTLFPSPDRPGCPSSTITVDVNAGRADPAPGPVSNLVPTTVNGLPVLTWDPATPDSGDSIAFYRIYRDPSATPQYSERYGKTQDSTTHTFTDAAPGASATHTYAVTAVDSHYQESAPVTVTWP